MATCPNDRHIEQMCFSGSCLPTATHTKHHGVFGGESPPWRNHLLGMIFSLVFLDLVLDLV